jgi:hypothetical protein
MDDVKNSKLKFSFLIWIFGWFGIGLASTLGWVVVKVHYFFEGFELFSLFAKLQVNHGYHDQSNDDH